MTQSAFAAAVLDPDLPVPDGITTSRGDVDASRFAVYRNNVYVGLVRALERIFPATRRIVGEDFFAGMARAYAAAERPSSPLLFDYGVTFPDFVDRFEPARGLPYLGDVARIEVAWLAAYHARDAAPLTLAELGDIEPDRLDTLALRPHPAARLLFSSFAAGSIWIAQRGDATAPIDAVVAEAVLVARPTLDVSATVLAPADAAFAAQLLAGASLVDAQLAAMALDGSFEFGPALVRLTAGGAFASIRESEQ